MKKYFYRHFFIFICLFAFQISLAKSEGSSKVISSTESEIHFVVDISSEKLDYFTNSDSMNIFYKSVLVGIPSGSTPKLTYSSGRSKSLNSDVELFRNKQILSMPLVELGEVKTMRNRQLVAVNIYPVMLDGFYQSVEVRISFLGGLKNLSEPVYDPIFDKMFKSSLVNYDMFKNFGSAESFLPKQSAASSVFTPGREWLKISVNQNGLYKITGADLENAGVVLNNFSSTNLGLMRGSEYPLDVANEEARPSWRPVSILIEDGGDGLFNSNDYFLFYGESQNRWNYQTLTAPNYVNHAYSDKNIYWLEISGDLIAIEMREVDVSITGNVNNSVDTTISTFRKYVHVEQNNLLRKFYDGHIFDYFRWYWTSDDSLTFFVNTPELVENDTVNIDLYGQTVDTTISTDNVGYMNIFVNNNPGIDKSCNRSYCSYRSPSFLVGANRIDLKLWADQYAAPYFDYIDINYTAYIISDNDKLDLTIGKTDANAEISIVNNFSTNPVILDITDPMHPILLNGSTINSSNISFYDVLSSTDFKRYYLTPENKSLSPLSIEAVVPTDLVQASQQIDLIVVTPKIFVSALNEYISYRRNTGYSIQVVTVEDIMDNFGFGLYDPTAIRDFLKYAYENYSQPAPSAVLFVGDGNYDYLNIKSNNVPNYVPPFHHEFDQTASDDNYLYFGDFGIIDYDSSYNNPGIDRGFDMICARWPVSSLSEIAIITDKIKRYESSANYGIWRNNIILVADDEYGAYNTETFHTTQTEELEKNYIPSVYNRDKIYLWEYPFVNNYKPAVNDAIVQSINDGALLINYVGHGNPNLWAHEHVFTRNDDLPRLTNYDKLPLFFAASCDIGFFDNPEREGMAEDLLSLSSGALGVISATRLVYSSENAAFNRKVFDVMFSDNSLSICEALYTAKLQRQYAGVNPIPIKNDRKFLFFGEPFVKLGQPKLNVNFTNKPDSIIALGKINVSGQILSEDSSIFNQDGNLTVNVFDSQREKTFRLINVNGVVTQTINYLVNGPAIFRGTAVVNSGLFDFNFIPPLDIGYGGNGSKILVYSVFDNADAVGLIEQIPVAETIASSNDTTGPSIEIIFEGVNNFRSGDLIQPNQKLTVTLSDSSGINITGGLGHGITLEIDQNAENMINLTPLFAYDENGYTSGSLEYIVKDLSPGLHHLKLKVWDNANNSTVTSIDVEVIVSQNMAIRNLLNYPNPMSSSTVFSYELTQLTEKFSLDIFTLSGKKIKSYVRYSLDAGYYDDIVWYGKDFDGDRVATQVYIYKATAIPAGGGEQIKSFGKLVLIN